MNKISKYKGVNYDSHRGKVKAPWRAQMRQSKHNLEGLWRKFCKTGREAAIAYDIKCIELGLEPVNILKKKTT